MFLISTIDTIFSYFSGEEINLKFLILIRLFLFFQKGDNISFYLCKYSKIETLSFSISRIVEDIWWQGGWDLLTAMFVQRKYLYEKKDLHTSTYKFNSFRSATRSEFMKWVSTLCLTEITLFKFSLSLGA